MKLAGVNDNVLAVVRISRMTSVFEIHAVEGAALRAFGVGG